MNNFNREQIGNNIILAEQYLENGHNEGAIACALIAIAKLKFREMKEIK